METEESESEEEEDESIEENDRIKMDMQPVDDMSTSDEEDANTMEPSVMDTVSVAGIEDVIDEAEVQKFRDEVENLQWPDYVDIPMDQLARERFQRYRGLKSFRSAFFSITSSI